MLMRRTTTILLALGLLSFGGCGRNVDPEADRAGARAAEAVEAREDDDPGFLNEEIHEAIARKRAELASDVGADPSTFRDQEARTAAEILAAGDADYETPASRRPTSSW